MHNTYILLAASIDSGKIDAEHSENPQSSHKYQMSLHNISVVLQSLNITPILWLVT